MHRGCMSDSKNSRMLCEENGDMCVTCNKGGCNNHGPDAAAKLSCHKCNDSSGCAYGQVGQEKTQKCTLPVRVSSMF